MNPITDESYFDLLIDNNIVELYSDHGAYPTFPVNPKASLLLLPGIEFQMDKIGTYPYAFFPSLFTLNSDVCTYSNVDKIQNNPNFGLFGQGVLVAVIDTGIDYTHPAFRYLDGTSRILSLWNQTIPNGPAPAGFAYGTEYNSDMINTALQTQSPQQLVPSKDEAGHGTAIAGIIAGSYDSSNDFHGIVPQSEYLIVKLKPAKAYNKTIFCISKEQLCYEETDVIAALSYVTEKARQLRLPLAICIAMGTSQGGHNGKGATSGYLNYITQSPHLAVSVAAGNEGNKRRHFHGKIDMPYHADFELQVDAKDASFSMEIWTASPYRLSIDITSPGGETIRGVYPRINECRKLDFIFSPSTLWVNNVMAESDTGDQMILLRFSKAFHGVWRFRVYSIDQEPTFFHVWLPAGELLSQDTFFLNSDPDCTLTSPANAESPFVVVNYNEETSSVSPDSSRGYTRYDLIKPDLAAPGTNLMAPLPNNRYGSLTGSGAASAHTTGLMAMVLEWAVVQGRHRTISGSDINRLLIRGAFRTNQTTYPNKQTGYGLTDIYGLFEKLI